MSLSGRRFLVGSACAVATTAAVSAVMVPIRDHMSVATSGLVLVVPVVIGVVVGGFAAGVLSVVVGFLAYDVLFIPPYGTLTVGASQNWVALGVYAAVMLLVARVVSALSAARTEARGREEQVRRLFELSDLVVAEHRETDLLERVATTVRDVFGMTSVVLLLSGAEGLKPVAVAGAPWSEQELAALVPRAGVRVPATMAQGETRAMALTATGAPLGLIGLRGPELDEDGLKLLRLFTNQAAMSLERGRLRQQAVRAEVAEQTERVQTALIGAVSHDLRTPLATIKVAASTLDQTGRFLDEGDRAELLHSIDQEADRLSRLVTNLLDMTRVQAGALHVAEHPVPVCDLVTDALSPLDPLFAGRQLTVSVPDELPMVLADHVLIGQVLVNLLENAARHSPEGTPVRVSAAGDGNGRVVVTVADEGPGLGVEGDAVFEPFHARGPGQGSGVGLSIAKAFVEAHGQRIWTEAQPGGGARFCFTLSAMADGDRDS